MLLDPKSRDSAMWRGRTEVGTDGAQRRRAVKGRITERQLDLAEASIPGISRFYAEKQVKPATFLQLLWAFEGSRIARPTRRKRRSR